MNYFKTQLLLILILFTCCKKIDNRTSSSIVNSEIKKGSNTELRQSTPDCIFKDQIKIVLETDNSNELLASMNSDSFKEQLKVNLSDLDFINNEVSITEIECNEDSFVIKYKEQLGNNYSITHHVFNIDEKSQKPVWSKIYRIETNRQGFEIYGAKVENNDISIYDGNENIETDLISIYSFNGYQDNKEPTIDAFSGIIKSNLDSKENLSVICDRTVLNCIVENISIDKNNLSQFNAISYHLERENFMNESIYVLENISKALPAKAEIHIKIGDAYWKMQDKERARKSYKTYVELVNNDQKKIPQRIFDRIN